MPRKIDISHKTVVFIAIFVLAIWVTLQVIDLLLLLFGALILTSALAPIVGSLVKLRVPKALGILITYIIIIGLLAGMLVMLIPPFVEQTNRLLTSLPSILANQFALANIDQSFLQSELANQVKNIVSLTLAVFSNFITVIFMLVITFYLLLERENLEERTARLFVGREERIKSLLMKIEDKLGAWLRGQLFLSLIIGLLSYIGLTLLHIPYALPLAILAGVMEVVPVIGPIISAIPAVLIALTSSPALAAGVTAMYFIIQQLENHLIVPQVMRRAVGLNPLVVILAISLGGRLLGVAGALLAVPLVVVIQVILADVLLEKKV